MFGNETWGDKIYKELSDDEKSKIQGYPIPEPLPTLPGYEPLDPDKLGPNHTGGKANYVYPKTGWILSPDRAVANSHGGSAWKLIDKKGNRIAALDKNGNVVRK